MIEEGMLLYFVPPFFASGVQNIDNKKRIMLVVEKNDQDNTITLINISKVSGKPSWFTYPYNVLIRNFNPPLPLLSFAKINDNYILENFSELTNYLYKGGVKIDKSEFTNIINRYNKYILNNRIELISFTKNDFSTTNYI